MIDTLEKAVRSRWAELRLPGKPPRSFSFFLFEGTPGRHGNVMFHVFRDQDATPLLVGKIPRDGVARRRVIHEHDFLKELEESAPRLAGVYFPRPLILEQTGTRTATGQTILASDSTPERETEDMGPEATREIYAHARNWLLGLWKGTGFLEGTEAALWSGLVRSTQVYLETFQPREEERHALQSLIAEIESRHDRVALYSYGHGTFELANLRIRGARVGAANWEHSARRQLPWVDPLHFAIAHCTQRGEASGGTLLSGFEQGFFESGWLRDQNRGFLEECFLEGGVPLDQLPLVVIASVLDSMHRRIRALPLNDLDSVQWRHIVERCLRPGAREELEEFWG